MPIKSKYKKATVLVASWLVALFLLYAAINGHCDSPTVQNRTVIDVIFIVLGTMRGNLAKHGLIVDHCRIVVNLYIVLVCNIDVVRLSPNSDTTRQ